MKAKKLKPHQLFDDLAEKQKIIKTNSTKTTLEEARALAKWIKEDETNKKERPGSNQKISPATVASPFSTNPQIK